MGVASWLIAMRRMRAGKNPFFAWFWERDS